MVVVGIWVRGVRRPPWGPWRDRQEGDGIAAASADAGRVIKERDTQPCIWPSGEGDTVAPSYRLPKLSQGGADTPDRPVPGKGIGSAAEHRSGKETTDPMASPKLRPHEHAGQKRRPVYTNCSRKYKRREPASTDPEAGIAPMLRSDQDEDRARHADASR